MPAIKMGEFPPEMNEVSRPGILSRGFRREARFAGDAQTPSLISVTRRACPAQGRGIFTPAQTAPAGST